MSCLVSLADHRYKEYTDHDQTETVKQTKTDEPRLKKALKSCEDVLKSCKSEHREVKTSSNSCSKTLRLMRDCEKQVKACEQRTMDDEFKV